MELNKIIHGDCSEAMKDIPDESIDAVITDPPYELTSGKNSKKGFMGKDWDGTGITHNVEMWKQCLRVLKPGGYLLSFGGCRTYHRMVCAIEDAGFEIRDQIIWVFGSGFPKSRSIGKDVDKLQGNEREEYLANIAYSDSDCWGTPNNNKGSKTTIWQEGGIEIGKGGKVKRSKGTSEWEGWGSALKPALEPICMARKPLSEKTIAKNCLKWGTGGINIDASRIEKQEGDRTEYGVNGIERKNNNNVYGKQYGKIKFDGTQGRFPANLIHDGSDEVRSCFPGTKTTWISPTHQNNRNGEFLGKIKHPGYQGYNDSGNASRYFKSIKYCPKASKRERNRGCEGTVEKQYSYDGRNKTIENPYQRNKSVSSNNHPTVKPIALIEYLINMVSREGATILDPFMGSGTTALAAIQTGRNFIGIEQDFEYVNISNQRIKGAQKEVNHKLF